MNNSDHIISKSEHNIRVNEISKDELESNKELESDNKLDKKVESDIKLEKNKEGTESEARNIKVRKNNKKYSKAFKCDKCDKSYTWYSGLSIHKRFVHYKPKES